MLRRLVGICLLATALLWTLFYEAGLAERVFVSKEPDMIDMIEFLSDCKNEDICVVKNDFMDKFWTDTIKPKRCDETLFSTCAFALRFSNFLTHC